MSDRTEVDFVRCASCGLLKTRAVWLRLRRCERCAGDIYREPATFPGTRVPMLSPEEIAYVMATMEKHA